MTERDLLKLKEDIEEAKEKFQQLKGQKNALMQQLKEEWDCTTIKDAHKILKKLKIEVEEISNEIVKGLDELEKKYLNDTDGN
jgi:predicted nuclease with TOPRIM domain